MQEKVEEPDDTCKAMLEPKIGADVDDAVMVDAIVREEVADAVTLAELLAFGFTQDAGIAVTIVFVGVSEEQVEPLRQKLSVTEADNAEHVKPYLRLLAEAETPPDE